MKDARQHRFAHHQASDGVIREVVVRWNFGTCCFALTILKCQEFKQEVQTRTQVWLSESGGFGARFATGAFHHKQICVYTYNKK